MNRRREFDVLRGLACLGVVYLHVAAPALRQTDDMIAWHVSNLITSLCTAAVPVFFMMSGALALGREKTADIGDLFRRRLWRVLVPFAVWSCIMLGYFWWRDGFDAALRAAKGILHTPVTTPYWFLYAYLPLLLIAPLLRKLVDGMSKTHWNYLLGLWLVFTVLPHTLPVSMRVSWHPGYSLNFLGGMAGYYLLGYRLTQIEVKTKPRWFAYAAALLVLCIAGGTYVLSVRHAGYSELMKSYLSLFVVLLAVSLFLFARTFLETHPKRGHGKGWGVLANASFGVYLSHPLLMDVIRRAVSGETLIQIDSLGVQAWYYAAVALSAVVLSTLAGKLPGIGYLLCGSMRKRG